MGQYYKAVLKEQDGNEWKAFHPTDFGTYLKLMEHSYVDTLYTSFIRRELYYNPSRVVWAGDYADAESGQKSNLYELAKEQTIIDCEKMDKELTYKILKLSEESGQLRLLLNHDKKLYVDYKKLKKNEYGRTIDPLPLLTAEGNGRGGGDYRGEHQELVGTWARDLISVSNKVPKDGYAELVTDFAE